MSVCSFILPFKSAADSISYSCFFRSILGISNSFVLIDDFLNCGNIQFFCYAVDSYFHYTLQSLDHSVLISSCLHGSSKPLSIPPGRSVYFKGLSLKVSLFQEQIQQLLIRNSILQTLISSQDSIPASFLHPLLLTKDPPPKKPRVHKQISITSYNAMSIGHAIVLHICGSFEGSKGEELIVSVASSSISFSQNCDVCDVKSDGSFSAELRLQGSFPSIHIPLFVFISDSHSLHFADVIQLYSLSTVPNTFPYPRFLYDKTATASVRKFFFSSGLLNESFLSSTIHSITLPFTIEEAEVLVKLCHSYLDKTKCCLDVSEIPSCRQLVLRLRESLLEEALFCKSQVVVSFFKPISSIDFGS